MGRTRNRSGRVNTSNANSQLHSINQTIRLTPVPRINFLNPNLTLYEDRRTWHPEGAQRPARSFNQSRHRLKDLLRRSRYKPTQYTRRASPLKNQNYLPPTTIAFQAPQKVLVCVRRKIRKEILHAFKKTGKSGRKQKKPRFGFYSRISCRR